MSHVPATRARSSTSLAAALLILGGPATLAAQGFLGAAQSFGVLGAATVTNTGATTIVGDLGVHPGLAISGLGTIVIAGSVHQGDVAAQQAQRDAALAFVDLMARPSAFDLTGRDLGGLTLTPGVYFFASSAQLTGNLFLDFLGNAASSFVFQIGSTLTTATASSITVRNGGPGSGVYFQVGSSATLGTASTFVGNLIADQSITLARDATITCGRALALNAAVTLDANAVSNDCGAADFGSVGFSGAGATSTVPEPTTLTLFGLGGAGLLFLARRGRRREAIARA